MDYCDLQPETNLSFKEDDEKLNQNQKYNFHLISLTKIEYEISLELRKKSLFINATFQEKNKNIKNIYEGEFTLEYLRKYFDKNYSIDKCYNEIVATISKSEKNGLVNELNNKIEIVIFKNSQIQNEISFILKRKIKSADEKIDELYDLINNLYKEKEEQKKQIEKLKEKLETFTNQEIHIIGTEGKENGLSFELTAFDEKKFKSIMDKDEELKNDEIYIRILLKFDANNNENLIKYLESEIEDFKKPNLVASLKNNFIIFDTFSQFNLPNLDLNSFEKESNLYKNFLNINDLLDININFKTDLLIQDIFEAKSYKEIFDIFFKFKCIIKGLSLNCKLWLKSIIYQIVEQDKLIIFNEENQIMKKLYKYLIMSLNNRISPIYLNKNHLDGIYKLFKLEEDKFKSFQKELKSEINFFENFKNNYKKEVNNNDKDLFKAIDFENILIYFVIPSWKIGFEINLNFPSLNQVIKEEIDKNILDKKDEEKEAKIEEKKEAKTEEKKEKRNKIFKKSKTVIEKKKVKKIENKEEKGEDIIKEDEFDIIDKFRKEFNLSEQDYSNLHLAKILRKYNYNFSFSFTDLIDN